VNEGITIIVPTVGRDTLQQTLESFAGDVTAADDVFVIHDGPQENDQPGAWVRLYARQSAGDWFFLQRDKRQGRFGHPNRNHILENHVSTTHVWTIDDDDVAAPGALGKLREHMHEPWCIFQMWFGENSPHPGVTLPYTRKITYGNLGTPMIFAPWTKARFGHHYSGDFDYAKGLHAELGDPVWVDEPIAIIRP
jgi:hypothetical protein